MIAAIIAGWRAKFLLYYPLKQGLKHYLLLPFLHERRVFTLLSIKTRIETRTVVDSKSTRTSFYSTIH